MLKPPMKVQVTLDTPGTLEGHIVEKNPRGFDPDTYKIKTVQGNWFYARQDQITVTCKDDDE